MPALEVLQNWTLRPERQSQTRLELIHAPWLMLRGLFSCKQSRLLRAPQLRAGGIGETRCLDRSSAFGSAVGMQLSYCTNNSFTPVLHTVGLPPKAPLLHLVWVRSAVRRDNSCPTLSSLALPFGPAAASRRPFVTCRSVSLHRGGTDFYQHDNS